MGRCSFCGSGQRKITGHGQRNDGFNKTCWKSEEETGKACGDH